MTDVRNAPIGDVQVGGQSPLSPRKSGETERQDGLALFEALIENMQDGVLVETGERRIFAVNTAFCRMFAIPAPPTVLVGADCSNAAEAAKALLADPDTFPRRIAEIVGARQPVIGEEVVFAAGTVFERDYIPIVSAEGRFIGHMWRYRDITARKRAAEDLRFRGALLEAQSEASIDGILIVSLEGRILSFNRRFVDMWRIPNDVLATRSDDAAIAFVCDRLVDPREFQDRIAYLYQHSDEVSRDLLHLRDGSIFERYSTLIRAPDGTQYGRIWFFHDATDQHRAEERLRFLTEASSLLASSLDFEATLESVVRLAVPRLADICILDVVDSQEEIQRLKFAAIDRERMEVLEQLRRRYPPTRNSNQPAMEAIRTGKPFVLQMDETVAAARASDRDHLQLILQLGLFSTLAVPLIARGRTVGALTLGYCTSDRQYADADMELALELARRVAAAVDNAGLYRTAEHANRAKSEFLAVMSHELRTPINAILGYTDLWLTGLPEALSPAMRSQVERVAWSTHHLRELIEGILTFSRIEAGVEDEPHVEEIVLRSLVDSVVALIEPLALRQKLTFEVDVATPEARLQTDPGKLRQILINLLSNAVKFTPRGTICFETRVDGENAVFSVRDSGIGIAPDHLDQIFEPFWQVEQSPARRKGGTGLGLSVARKFARLLGGDVTAESSSGNGSVFTLRLPALLS